MKKWLLVFLLLFAACGKNDAVRNVGTGGPYAPQAPYNPNYPQGPQNPQYPPFNPQLPPGMPPQYTPWLPVDNYFRQQPPQVTNVYINVILPQWQQYANYYGYNQYDFNTFWYDYCPQYVIPYGYMDAGTYSYYDSYYYWAGYGSYGCDYGCDSYDYWSYYY